MSKAITIHSEYMPSGDLTYSHSLSEEERQRNLQELVSRMEARAYTDASKVQPTATHWIIDQFLPEGHTTLAGASFVGKTYVLANLVATILGIVSHEGVTASRRRKVIWLTEDDNQIAQAVMVLDYLTGYSMRDFFEGCLIVPAERVPAEDLGDAVKMMIEDRGWNKESNPPLILVDTMAASLDCDDINNPSKASKLLAVLRVTWSQYSVIITMHTSKSGDSKEAMGSTAFKADMQNSFYVVKLDEDHRELGHTKRRSAGKYSRLVSAYEGNIPVDLPNREGHLVTEWVPKIRLVAQTSAEAKEWDTEHKPSAADTLVAVKAENADAALEWLEEGEKEAKNKTVLSRQMADACSFSLPTAKRRVNELIEDDRLMQEGVLWRLKGSAAECAL